MLTCQNSLPVKPRRIYVAFSGGLDSSVLLHCLLSERPDDDIVAWHVNHGLQAAADQMEDFCRQRAEQLGVELRIDRLDMQDTDRNVEAEARRQRYELFAAALETGDLLLTAHHADDQAETFLLNALRGSGSAGLRGIAAERMLGNGQLVRPLLEYSREELEAYAAQHELAWCNDPSNSGLRFDRNFLRREVMPVLKTRWPHLLRSFSTVCELQVETRQILDEVADIDLASCADGDDLEATTIHINRLLTLTLPRRKNLLRHWIAQAGLASPPQARLETLLQQLHARPGTSPRIDLPGYSIRVYDHRLFLVPEDYTAPAGDRFDFGLAPEIAVSALALESTREAILTRLGVEDDHQPLSIRLRNRGSRNADRHRLKRLFQQGRVPPWRRDSVPQVYLGDRLVGILP